jgi:hypothetical protein
VNQAGRICRRRAELLRELARLDEELARALEAAPDPEERFRDATLDLSGAAAYMGEPKETFRRRLDYRKAIVSREGERRLRYSRAALDRIKADRLAASAVACSH